MEVAARPGRTSVGLVFQRTFWCLLMGQRPASTSILFTAVECVSNSGTWFNQVEQSADCPVIMVAQTGDDTPDFGAGKQHESILPAEKRPRWCPSLRRAPVHLNPDARKSPETGAYCVGVGPGRRAQRLGRLSRSPQHRDSVDGLTPPRQARK